MGLQLASQPHLWIYIIIIYVMELVHLLTRSGLTYPEVPSKVYHDSFCKLGSIGSLPWVIYFEAFYLHVSSFSCIPAICPKLVLLLTPGNLIQKYKNYSTPTRFVWCTLPSSGYYTHKGHISLRIRVCTAETCCDNFLFIFMLIAADAVRWYKYRPCLHCSNGVRRAALLSAITQRQKYYEADY